jgi:hypothetical protein
MVIIEDFHNHNPSPSGKLEAVPWQVFRSLVKTSSIYRIMNRSMTVIVKATATPKIHMFLGCEWSITGAKMLL